MPKSYTRSVDNDGYDSDPGGEVIKKNHRERLQRVATNTKDELNRILIRVDGTLTNYDNAVKSSLLQRGMSHEQMADIEQVADLKELEEILNDTMAKKRYQQRLTVFIVGRTEQIQEKAKVLQQIEQFFIEQKQNFIGKEFQEKNENLDEPDDVDLMLRSFDVKDCYSQVKSLGIRLTELNDEIITHLIQTAATKQQTKGKKKGNQQSKELKELQSRLEAANADIAEKSNRISELEENINDFSETLAKYDREKENSEISLKRYQSQIEVLKQRNSGLETKIEDLENQIESAPVQNEKPSMTDDATQCEIEEETVSAIETKKDSRKNSIVPRSTSSRIVTDLSSDSDPFEPDSNLNAIFNVPEGINLNEVTSENMATVFENLRRYGILRVRELINEIERVESEGNDKALKYKNELDSFKIMYEKERQAAKELIDNAYKLQMKAQTTAEEAMNHLKIYMREHDTQKPMSNEQATQTENSMDDGGNKGFSKNSVHSDEDQRYSDLSPRSQALLEEIEMNKDTHKATLKEKYLDLLDEKQHELDVLKQMAEMILSRPPTSDAHAAVNQHDEAQQTSTVVIQDDLSNPEKNQSESDSSHELFIQLYETIFKFRQSISNVLEQNKFETFADRLFSIQQLMKDDHPAECLKNSERLLKEMVKVIQTTMAIYASRIKEFEERENELSRPKLKMDDSIEPTIDLTGKLQENETIIIDLTVKYKKTTEILNQTLKEHEEEMKQNQDFMLAQQKQNEILQQELARLQKSLSRLEDEGLVEPSILFTRLDIERNDSSLKQAVVQGKISDDKYEELRLGMKDYVTLPGEQFRNLVERYSQHRRALEFSPDPMPTTPKDEKKFEVVKKMKQLHEQRSEEIRERMLNLRQQRVDLAKTLTENFDDLENQTNIFLIRPIYSYQGRSAVHKYIKLGNEKRNKLQQEKEISQPHHPSRLSASEKSISTKQTKNQSLYEHEPNKNDDDQTPRSFHPQMSYYSSVPTYTRTLNPSTGRQTLVLQLGDMSRLQELDLQRTVMPMAHTSTSLLSAFSAKPIEPFVSSLNLRSYVTLSRPGISQVKGAKSGDILTPVTRDARSGFSSKSQKFNPRTPLNSGAGETRNTSPALPPIKRGISNNFVQSSIEEVSHDNFNGQVN